VIAIDLFCGLGGWTDGLLAEGYAVTGYDIEAHEYGDERYPATLVLRDVLTINGAEFAHADLIVASPPCQEFSYMAMPWQRGKQIARALRGQDEFPPGYRGSRTIAELTALFDACFRIQREACEAAGRHIPMVVENVRGAEPWVGKARWSFGSYYLWGDVPALMPHTLQAQKFNPDGTAHGQGSWFAIADSKERGSGRKNGGMGGGSRFPIDNTKSRVGARNHARDGRKGSEGYECDHPAAFGWKKPGTSSNSKARKAASAKIAKIPFALSSWIARTYKPQERAA
jgi:hypothetical protein